jgi:hypothetical protein
MKRPQIGGIWTVAYYLPSRIPGYLRRLASEYARTNPPLNKLIVASRVLVVEETGYDNWNGGQHGHDVRLYIPPETLGEIEVSKQSAVIQTLMEDLRELAKGADHEFINDVHLESDEDDDPDFRRATAFSARPPSDPDRLGIWKQGLIRVFISHRDKHKAEAHELADALEPYGFSCFVAHDSIRANEEWRKAILDGLETMEVLLAFITDDFHESVWTMQEIGYAFGKGIRCIPLKLETKDPPGFLNHTQALRGSIERVSSSASKLFPLLSQALGQQERLQTALVTSFVASPDFTETRRRFEIMTNVITKLTEAELAAIIKGFYRNDQLHNAAYMYYHKHGRLLRFLEETGKEFEVLAGGRTIRQRAEL